MSDHVACGEPRIDSARQRPACEGAGIASSRAVADDPILWPVAALCAWFNRAAPEPRHIGTSSLASDEEALLRLLEVARFTTRAERLTPSRVEHVCFPVIVFARSTRQTCATGLALAANDQGVTLAERATPPHPVSWEVFADQFGTRAIAVADAAIPLTDPDAIHATANQRKFGFRWFLPELLKHKLIWREVLLASLVIQALGLLMPLVTQAVIDKVVVHRTLSTLVTLAIAMGIFALFTSALTWTRQYLVLHTGNRIDAALGAGVWRHLLKLPLPYFAHRPTGVVAARLHGIETIREFIASTAVTLALDAPFLLIFVAIMFWYSVPLTMIVLATLFVIGCMSFLIAPMFQRRLNEQFLRGARQQAFVTEYVAGMETVKSLQLEPQLEDRYGVLLASSLEAGMKTRQLANTYNTGAQTLEQLMTLLILTLGAWIVMTADMTREGAFTIGMLVAFQMFAQRVSQPLLRLVGLWQQFQQARLAVDRLGDLMNAPPEPYSDAPRRWATEDSGAVRIEQLAFRYAAELPMLYERLSFDMRPGSITAMMGPSGCGKSTLAKLLQGFYLPTSGTIRIDGVDTRHLSANELRACFGVVPQETLIFSGSVSANLQLARPDASFEDIVVACQQAQIHTTIEQLPAGYDTELGERGTGLSGGQKQRLAIARALLKRPRILVFDEAIANLDAATAEEFTRTVNTLKGSVTILFITHALPRSLHVDQIVRLGPKLEILTAVPRTAAPGKNATEVVRQENAAALRRGVS